MRWGQSATPSRFQLTALTSDGKHGKQRLVERNEQADDTSETLDLGTNQTQDSTWRRESEGGSGGASLNDSVSLTPEDVEGVTHGVGNLDTAGKETDATEEDIGDINDLFVRYLTRHEDGFRLGLKLAGPGSTETDCEVVAFELWASLRDNAKFMSGFDSADDPWNVKTANVEVSGGPLSGKFLAKVIIGLTSKSKNTKVNFPAEKFFDLAATAHESRVTSQEEVVASGSKQREDDSTRD